jgi:uncharacterized membrane protein
MGADLWSVVAIVSIAFNVFLLLFGLFREASYRAFAKSMEAVGDTLSELSSAFHAACRRTDDDRADQRDFRTEIRQSIRDSMSSFDQKIAFAVNVMRQAGVNINNMQSRGQGQIGRNDGGINQE